MIEAWTAPDVRAAEKPLLAAGEPLMSRAAHALAATVLRDVAARRRSLAPGSPPRLRGGLGSDGLPGEAAVRGPGAGRRGAGARGAGARGDVRGARAVLLVGAGNNGGDTLFAGALLARRGLAVTAVLAAPRVHDAGLAALRAAGGRVVSLFDVRVPVVVAEVAEADVVLDGLVGIGAHGVLRPPAGGLVRALADARAALPHGAPRPWVVAVDVPSGIGVDDGTVAGPVLPADRTVTFGALKPGLVLPPAVHLAGIVEVVDLGLGLGDRRVTGGGAPGRSPASGPAVRRLEARDVAALLRVPGPRDHKYTRGVVGVVAGTEAFPGAAVLAVSGAARAGAGMVRYLGPESVGALVLGRRPEVVTTGGRVQSWVLGPGVPADDDAADDQGRRIFGALAAVTGLLSADVTGGAVPAVVDAGAIELVEHRCPPSVVITPHAGELTALMQRLGHGVDRAGVEAEPLRWARAAHEATGATVLLKGSVTVIAGQDGVFAQADGPAWLATAGAGDVLAGLLGTLLASRSADVLARPGLAAELAAAAVLLHGRAAWAVSGGSGDAQARAGAGTGARAGGPVVALDVADALPAAIADVLAGA
ncbi:bifunctional ADP-dependent NAD(P)H-hydrate dehydratase/NAD(P)H-hydrate epimerase [Antribacter sp. KLBMP9083]|uniref:Multifunctional fusion protein n=1 Tax=Antribacter soli TaxID=2910976 RepID=A0AA41U8R8_9MICO|nr:bifunctional ADP-dependent NAD(P)H-hydrate dehydratase/NAD(P)H-hydrate epimerase [Antribacter soli]MCF4122730.1 bifunctional ADP-dependent NAD(P)H-hydrate dehydratase/NAD(P)H-hydrate epimerase [Antribacter soli]